MSDLALDLSPKRQALRSGAEGAFLDVILGCLNVALIVAPYAIGQFVGVAPTVTLAFELCFILQILRALGHDVVWYLYGWTGRFVFNAIAIINAAMLLRSTSIMYVPLILGVVDLVAAYLDDYLAPMQTVHSRLVVSGERRVGVAAILIVGIGVSMAVTLFYGYNDMWQIVYWVLMTAAGAFIAIEAQRLQADEATTQWLGHWHALALAAIVTAPTILAASGADIWMGAVIVGVYLLGYIIGDIHNQKIVRLEDRDAERIYEGSRHIENACVRYGTLIIKIIRSSLVLDALLAIIAGFVWYNMWQCAGTATYQFPREISSFALDIETGVTDIWKYFIQPLRTDLVQTILFPLLDIIAKIQIAFHRLMLHWNVIDDAAHGISQSYYIYSDGIAVVGAMLMLIPGFSVLVNCFPMTRSALNVPAMWMAVQLGALATLIALLIGPVSWTGFALRLTTTGTYTYSLTFAGRLMAIACAAEVVACALMQSRIKQAEVGAVTEAVEQAGAGVEPATISRDVRQLEDKRMRNGCYKAVVSPGFVLGVTAVVLMIFSLSLETVRSDITISHKNTTGPSWYSYPGTALLQTETHLLEALPKKVIVAAWLFKGIDSVVGDDCLSFGDLGSVCISDIIGTVTDWIEQGVDDAVSFVVDQVFDLFTDFACGVQPPAPGQGQRVPVGFGRCTGRTYSARVCTLKGGCVDSSSSSYSDGWQYVQNPSGPNCNALNLTKAGQTQTCSSYYVDNPNATYPCPPPASSPTGICAVLAEIPSWPNFAPKLDLAVEFDPYNMKYTNPFAGTRTIVIVALVAMIATLVLVGIELITNYFHAIVSMVFRLGGTVIVTLFFELLNLYWAIQASPISVHADVKLPPLMMLSLLAAALSGVFFFMTVWETYYKDDEGEMRGEAQSELSKISISSPTAPMVEMTRIPPTDQFPQAPLPRSEAEAATQAAYAPQADYEPAF